MITNVAKVESDAERRLAWLKQRLTPSTDETAGHVVTEVVPEGFPAYVRVFHAWLAEDDPDLLSTWRERAEIAGARYHGELTSHALASALPRQGGARWVVDEGELDPRTRNALVRILTGVTADQPVYFAYDLAMIVGGDEPVVWRSSLDGLDEVRTSMYPSPAGFEGPEHWWPEDHSWVVGTDYDLCSTYIACSDELARLLTEDEQVEAVLVMPESRVDNGADALNKGT
jgi:hypothetical protein